jgi:hypothetical protein
MHLKIGNALSQYAEVLRKETNVEASLKMHKQALEIYLHNNDEERNLQQQITGGKGRHYRRMTANRR